MTPPPAPAVAHPRKDQSIETLRAIAVSLVVGFHIRGDGPVADAAEFYEWLAYTFRSIRIPLFTVISGYLYAVRPVAADGYRDFVRGKLRRLLLPLLVVSTLEYLFRALAPGVNNAAQLGDMWQIYVLPYAHYWFLQAVILALLLVGALDAKRRLEHFGHWLLALLLAMLVLQLSPFAEGSMEPFSVGGFLFLLPFFLLGLGIHRFRAQLMSERTIAAAAVAFVASLAVLQANWVLDGALVDSSKKGVSGLLLGVSGCLLLFRFRPSNRFLAWVGGFSFSIYLFQAFGSGFGRRLLGIPGIDPHVYFLSLLAFTVAFGIAVDLVASRIPAVRTLLLGKP